MGGEGAAEWEGSMKGPGIRTIKSELHLILYDKLLISQVGASRRPPFWKPPQASSPPLPACLLPLSPENPRFYKPVLTLQGPGPVSQLAGVVQSRCCPTIKGLQGTQHSRQSPAKLEGLQACE